MPSRICRRRALRRPPQQGIWQGEVLKSIRISMQSRTLGVCRVRRAVWFRQIHIAHERNLFKPKSFQMMHLSQIKRRKAFFLDGKVPSAHMVHVGTLPFIASEGCQLSLHRARLHPSNASQARTSRCLQQFAAVLLPYAGWLVLESLQ